MTKKSWRLILVNMFVRSWSNSSLYIQLVMRFEIIISRTKTPQSHLLQKKKPLKKLLIEWKFPVMRCFARHSDETSSSFSRLSEVHQVSSLKKWNTTSSYCGTFNSQLFEFRPLLCAHTHRLELMTGWLTCSITHKKNNEKKHESCSAPTRWRQQKSKSSFFRWIFAEQPEKMRFRK